MENEEKETLIDDLKSHLQSMGWDAFQADMIVDGIVESFGSELLPEGFASYDELARNQGAGDPPLFDEKAVSLLDEIKALS